MQHHLLERHEGHREPRHLPVALLAAAAAMLAAGCGEEQRQTDEAAPQRSIVLVSGRDDHGLLAEPTIGLSEAPEGATKSRVGDGTLVFVIATRGEWLEVRTLEGPSAQGWVNDFYLRGVVHLFGRSAGCAVRGRSRPGGPIALAFPGGSQAELLAVARVGGRSWVRVRALADQREAWVPREVVSELPDRRRPHSGCP